MIRTDPRHRVVARRLLLIGLGLGLLAEVALDGPAPGIGVPVMAMAVLLAGWSMRRRDRAPDSLDAWLVGAAAILATLVAIRADPFLALLDGIVAAALVGASLTAFSGLAVTRRRASVIVMMAAWGLADVLTGAARNIRLARPTRDQLPRSLPSWAAPVGRGMMIALPIASILVFLFATADPIFRDAVADVLGFRPDLGDLPGRALFTVSAAWVLAGLVSIPGNGVPNVERASLGAAARVSPIGWSRTIGLTETLVVLAIIDLVIASFVVLQIGYLFGGLDTMKAAGIPYARYARRGFFELVAAASLVSSVVVVLEAMIERRTRVYVAAVAALIGLTGLVLASAALRLSLYQAAYGWTDLRLYVFVAIGTMGLGLAVMLALLLARRSRWLSHALAALGIASLIGLNLIAPAAFVAARNIERALDPSLVPVDGHSGLDASYLAVLPDDAIPVLVDALPRLRGPEAAEVRALLLARRNELAVNDDYHSPFAWNAGRQRAVEVLAALP
jgi:two-component system sensor histidine kinase BaeS